MSSTSTLDLFAYRRSKHGRAEDETRRPTSTSTSEPKPLTVSQLNTQARMLLEQHFGGVCVLGEVSNFKKSPAGHCYFSLKDDQAQLAVVLFRREAQALRTSLRDGAQIVVTGRLTIYERGGRYQLIANRIEDVGAGALHQAFEELKRKLLSEGLFETSRKRRLPFLPRRVAVLTSPTGAVLRDMVHVARRRFPAAHILLVPCTVQGEDCAPSIANAFARLNALHVRLGVDVAVLARGGGSLEDLWGFNTEVVARAIAGSHVPVVSAVGHETDVSIADFVADRRAPTPSAAAEIVFPVQSECVRALTEKLHRCASACKHRVLVERPRMQSNHSRLRAFEHEVRVAKQRIAESDAMLQQSIRVLLGNTKLHLGRQEKRLAGAHPKVRLAGVAAQLRQFESRLRRTSWQVDHRKALRDGQATHSRAMRRYLEGRQNRLSRLVERLEALSPLRVLARGYSIALDQAGRPIRSSADVAAGDDLLLRLSKGSLRTRVVAITE